MKHLSFLVLLVWATLNNVFAQPVMKSSWQNLMPKPKQISIQNGTFSVDENIRIYIPKAASKRVQLAATKFIRRLTNRTGLFVKNGFPKFADNNSEKGIVIQYQRKGKLALNEDESYTISVVSDQVLIQANTDLGVIYALETLLQLLDYNEQGYFFQNCNIQDAPAFTWRGLMIDAARHFQPVAVIKRNLDAMVVAKMNTFHWHLSDDQGFRVEIKKYPKLARLASDGQFYTQEQIKEVVRYANDRGIRIIPEIDVPGHATALLVAFPEIGSKKMTYQLERNAGIFDPTLDPANPKTYIILDHIFRELSALFSFPYFHIGGDENKGVHWDANPKIAAFKKQKGFKTNHELQTYFNKRLLQILKKYNKTLMGWEEIMTPDMPKNAIIHSWAGKPGESLAKAAKNGYKVVLSNGFYIDLLLPASKHYETSLNPEKFNLSEKEKKKILGGEATMWSELVTPLTIDSRIWPRTLAIGERLWSNPDKLNLSNMYQRMFAQSYHLEELGLRHLTAKSVILRNISENQDLSSLVTLSNVYEPLKYYTRNKGGKEYQTYSPFMLFADACTADAKDALDFEVAVNNYIVSNDYLDKRKVLTYLKLWSQNHHKLLQLKPNPKLIQLYPMSKSLSDVSSDILVLSNNLSPVDQNFVNKLKNKYELAIKPYNDVSLANANALETLIKYWVQQRNLKW